MTKKGITPIIAIIVLLLIVVALAGLAYTYLFGFLQTQIEGSFLIQPTGVFCDADSAGDNQLSVILTNTGTSTIEVTDWIVASVVGPTSGEIDVSADITGSIISGSALRVATLCGGGGTGGCDSGTNTVHFATGATAQSQQVSCP